MPWLTGPEYAGTAHLIINLQVGGSMPNSYINGDSTRPIGPAKVPAGPAGRVVKLDIDWVQD